MWKGSLGFPSSCATLGAMKFLITNGKWSQLQKLGNVKMGSLVQPLAYWSCWDGFGPFLETEEKHCKETRLVGIKEEQCVYVEQS